MVYPFVYRKKSGGNKARTIPNKNNEKQKEKSESFKRRLLQLAAKATPNLLGPGAAHSDAKPDPVPISRALERYAGRPVLPSIPAE